MASISIAEMMSNKNTDPKWMTEANRISVLVPPAAAAKTSKDLPKVEFRVKMCCAKCEEKVREEAGEVDGVVSVVTDRDSNKATVFGRVDSMAVLKKLKRHIDKKTTFWPPDQNLLQQQQQQQQPLILSKPSASYGKQEAASSKELEIMQKGKEKRENKVRQNNSRDDMITGTSSDRGLQKAKQVDMSSKNPRGEEKGNLQDPARTIRNGMVIEPVRQMQSRGIEVRAATRPAAVAQQPVETFKEMQPSLEPTVVENMEPRRGLQDVRESGTTATVHQVELQEKLRQSTVEPTRSETSMQPPQQQQQVEFKDMVQSTSNGPAARDHNSMQSFEVRDQAAPPVLQHQVELEKTRAVVDQFTRSEMMPRAAGDHMRPAAADSSPPEALQPRAAAPLASAPLEPPAAGNNMQQIRGPAAYIREMKMPVTPGELRAAESSREAMLRRPPQYIRVMRPLDPNGMPRAASHHHHIEYCRPEMREMTSSWSTHHPAAASQSTTAHADHHIKDSTQQLQQQGRSFMQQIVEPKDMNSQSRSSATTLQPQQGIISGRGPNSRSQTSSATASPATGLPPRYQHHPDYIPVDPRDYMRMNSSWESNIKAVDPRTVDPRELRGGDPADYRPAAAAMQDHTTTSRSSQQLHQQQFQSSTPVAPPPPPTTTTTTTTTTRHSNAVVDQSSSTATRPQVLQPAVQQDHIKDSTIPKKTVSRRADDNNIQIDFSSSPAAADLMHHVKFYHNDRLHDIPRDYQPVDAFFDDLYMRPSLLQSSFSAADEEKESTTRGGGAPSPQDDFFSQPITNPNYMKHILY
ncbi:unnamed protein product [Sphagnum balticum]